MPNDSHHHHHKHELTALCHRATTIYTNGYKPFERRSQGNKNHSQKQWIQQKNNRQNTMETKLTNL